MRLKKLRLIGMQCSIMANEYDQRNEIWGSYTTIPNDHLPNWIFHTWRTLSKWVGVEKCHTSFMIDSCIDSSSTFDKIIGCHTRYYNWGTGYSCMNDSKNFKAITDPKVGLIFESRKDRHQILMDPLVQPSIGTTRTAIHTDSYDSVVLFDNVVRKRI